MTAASEGEEGKAPQEDSKEKGWGLGAGRLQGFGGLRRRAECDGGRKGSGASRPPAHARTAGPDRAALGMPPPPQLRLLVCGKGRTGSGAGAPTPSRLGQLLRFGEPRMEQPTPGSRDPGENPAALFRAGRHMRACPGP